MDEILCAFDACHSFVPNVHNHVYCLECGCKRKEEARSRHSPSTLPSYDTKLWLVEEEKKRERLETRIAKDKWLLENKTFAAYDLETSNLDASIGEILCGCVKPLDGPIKTFVSGKYDDAKAAVAIRNELEKYDYIFGWYSTGFDFPYLTTRLMIANERVILPTRHIDLYYVARGKLKLHSNRQQVAGETLLGESNKTRLIGSVWNAAMKGSKEAMEYIIDHCQKDVEELEQLFHRLIHLKNISATPLKG